MNDIVLLKPSGEAFTTSILIAEKFGKRHDTVLRKIQNLPQDDFTHRNFAVSEYVDESGRKNKVYEISRDGFAILAMRFTGNKAYEWQKKFLSAFNKMEDHLQKVMQEGWLEGRTECAIEYKLMSRTIDEVRKLNGKETKWFHYANEAKLVNWAMTGEYKGVDRDSLDADELAILTNLEMYNTVLIGVQLDREARKHRLQARYHELTTELLPAA
ncbi:MAG: Rha family transcriptional regulator [Pseudomonadota bacterium]